MSINNNNNESSSVQSHLVFSDISHLGGGAGSLPTIKFAVGLREDASADELLGKIMPLTKVIPGKPIERAPREKKPIIEKECGRGDCQSKRNLLLELQSENEPFREQLRAMESKVENAKNKMALTERAIFIAEEKVEDMKIRIDELQDRVKSQNEEVTRMDTSNSGNRELLNQMRKDIDSLKAQTDSFNTQVHLILDRANEKPVRFASRIINDRYRNDKKNQDDISVISNARSVDNNYDIDSDDD